MYLDKAYLKPDREDSKLEGDLRADLRPEGADFRPERADFEAWELIRGLRLQI